MRRHRLLIYSLGWIAIFSATVLAGIDPPIYLDESAE